MRCAAYGGQAPPGRCAQVYVMPGEAIVRAGDMARELAFLAKVRALN